MVCMGLEPRTHDGRCRQIHLDNFYILLHYFDFNLARLYRWAVVGAQLEEWSLPIQKSN